MHLQDFYRQVLKAVNVEVGADDRLYTNYGERKPLLVNDQPLYFPSPELLRAGVAPGQFVFHPLSESLVRASESEVFSKLRSLVTYRLTVSISLLVAGYLDLGLNTSRHRSLPPNAHAVLSSVSDVDAKVPAAFAEILTRTDIDSPERLLGLYAKRGGTYRGEKYPQVMMAVFPLYEALEETDDGTVFGVSLRKKDIRILTDVIRYILPGLEDRETYSAPSSNRTTPMFHALLSAFAKIAKQINKLVNLHRDFLEDPSAIEIPMDWLEELDEISQWAGQIPNLPGNEGINPNAARTESIQAAIPAYGNAPAAVPSVPVAPSNEIRRDSDGIDLDDLLRKTRPQMPGYQPMMPQPMQPVQYVTRGGYAVQPPPQQVPYGYPQQYGGYPQQQPQMMQPQAAVPWANTQNGVVVATQTNPPMQQPQAGLTRGGYAIQQPPQMQPMGGAYRPL